MWDETRIGSINAGLSADRLGAPAMSPWDGLVQLGQCPGCQAEASTSHVGRGNDCMRSNAARASAEGRRAPPPHGWLGEVRAMSRVGRGTPWAPKASSTSRVGAARRPVTACCPAACGSCLVWWPRCPTWDAATIGCDRMRRARAPRGAARRLRLELVWCRLRVPRGRAPHQVRPWMRRWRSDVPRGTRHPITSVTALRRAVSSRCPAGRAPHGWSVSAWAVRRRRCDVPSDAAPIGCDRMRRARAPRGAARRLRMDPGLVR